LREQIKSLKSKYKFVQGGVSCPKDLILLEESEIKYDKETNRFLFGKVKLAYGREKLSDEIKQNKITA